MAQNLSRKWRVYCPSYRRAKIARSHNLFPKDLFSYVIRESELDSYRSELDCDFITIPDGKVHDISTTRNWILDNKKTEYICQVDDDLTHIFWLLHRERKHLSPDDLTLKIDNFFDMAEQLSVGLWGMNPVDDPKAYRTFNPFSLTNPVLGPFSGILDTGIRYDETLPLKEDYDLFLQHMQKYHRVLRVNFLMYTCDHQKLEGGCQSYRNDELEMEQNQLLIEKWGSNIVKSNHRNPDSINKWIDVSFLK